jgi:hypothetical protein
MDGKMVVVEEVQRCIGQDNGQLESAMRALLEKESFVIQPAERHNRPPYSDEPTLSKEPYDFPRLVQSDEYRSRYFKYGTVLIYYGLWGAKAGMTITNQFSADEKKIVAAFFAETIERPEGHSSDNKGITNKAATPADANRNRGAPENKK